MDEQLQYIFLPVIEGAMIAASHYCKGSGRDTVTATDVEYGLKYSIRNVLGNQIGSLFPDVYDSDSSDESDLEIVDEAEEPFCRYEGTDPLIQKINEAYDTWDDWVPESPAEIILAGAFKDKGFRI